MGLQSEVETALLELLDEEYFGSAGLTVDGVPLTAIWQAEDREVPGQFPGQIVQRRRLICAVGDFTAGVGEEVEINGERWIVVDRQPMSLTTDLSLERFTA